MSITDLIKSLADYIDIGKRVVNTVPGLLMAFAFLLLFSSPPDYFKSSFLAKSLRTAEEQLAKARDEQNTLTRTLSTATGEKVLEDERLTTLKASVCGAKQTPCAIPDDRMEAVRKQQSAAAAAGGEVSIINNQLTAKTEEVTARKAVVTELSRRLQDSGDFMKFVNSGVSGWLLFGLLGMAIGTVLDPLNKALFLQWLPELAPKRKPRRTFTRMLRPKDREDAAELERPVQFYIGAGVITQQEYDGLVSDYYRWSEISIGMILPVLAMSGAWIRQYYLRHGELPDAYLLGAVAVLALVLSAMLFSVGLRRYRDFQQQCNSFVRGRVHLQQEQLKRERERVDLATISQLIRESKLAADDLKTVRARNGMQ